MRRYPFNETRLTRNTVLREFSRDVNSGELVWHRDREDRLITVVEGSGWKLQLDNQLPVVLKEDRSYFIPAGKWHRVIKGPSELVVEIKKGRRRLIESDEKAYTRDDVIQMYSDAHKEVHGVRPSRVAMMNIDKMSVEQIWDEIDDLYMYNDALRDDITDWRQAGENEPLPDHQTSMKDMTDEDFIDPYQTLPQRQGMRRRSRR